VWKTPKVGNAPRLAAIMVNDRPGVIISDYDLSVSVLGCKQWSVNGFSTESSRQLMTNLVLWANSRPAPSPVAATGPAN
jgi:hypothetical protein